MIGTKRALVLVFAAGLSSILTSCGARTGLLIDDEADVGPAMDVFNDFPCTYSPIGNPTTVFDFGDLHTLRPRLVWGDDQLMLTFIRVRELGTREGEVIVCPTHPGEGFQCRWLSISGVAIIDPPGLAGGVTTWNGRTWGMCQTVEVELGVPISFLLELDSGALVLSGIQIGEDRRYCPELHWSEDHYLAGLVEDPDDPQAQPATAEMVHFDRAGSRIARQLEFPAPSSWQRGAAAAHSGMEVVAWSDDEAVRVERIDRSEEPIQLPLGAAEGSPVVAMRRPIVGILTHGRYGDGTRIHLTLVDMESGWIHAPVLIAEAEPEIPGTTLLAVDEGFVIAWSERNAERNVGRIVAVPVTVTGRDVFPWDPIVLHEGGGETVPSAGLGPALAYDARAVFAAFTMLDVRSGTYQVFMQQLECHR